MEIRAEGGGGGLLWLETLLGRGGGAEPEKVGQPKHNSRLAVAELPVRTPRPRDVL
jgi:hypothetical protein